MSALSFKVSMIFSFLCRVEHADIISERRWVYKKGGIWISNTEKIPSSFQIGFQYPVKLDFRMDGIQIPSLRLEFTGKDVLIDLSGIAFKGNLRVFL